MELINKKIRGHVPIPIPIIFQYFKHYNKRIPTCVIYVYLTISMYSWYVILGLLKESGKTNIHVCYYQMNNQTAQIQHIPYTFPSFPQTVIILLVIIYTRRRKPDQYALAVDPYDDIRENIMHYDEEGVGEEDQDAYDINRLKKPIEEPPPIRKPVPPTVAKPVRTSKWRGEV